MAGIIGDIHKDVCNSIVHKSKNFEKEKETSEYPSKSNKLTLLCSFTQWNSILYSQQKSHRHK